LEQFRLCPQYFLENFNRIQRANNETYRAFVSRLSRLLQYYLRSREVTDFENICQLLISDRVKTSLNESALKHVLHAESARADIKWLRPEALSDVLDTYYANFNFNDKPRASAIGATPSRGPASLNINANNARSARSQGRGHVNEAIEGEKPFGLAANNSGPTSASPLTSLPVSGNKPVRKCFVCSSENHIAKFCTNKGGAASGAKSGPSNNSGGNGPRYGRTWLPRGGAVNAIGASVNETVVKVADDSSLPAASDCDTNSAAQCNKVNCVVRDATKTGDSTHNKTLPSVCNCNNDDVIVKLAELHYLKVDVFGADHCWKALLDGGSEVDVINRAKLMQLSVPYDVVGDVALRPMAGPSIPAQLVRLQVQNFA
jgi:hypothetical protein